MTTPKITIEEARELGLLQEINRRVLHPAGLALGVTFDRLGRGLSFEAEILDAREDPAGFAFGFGSLPGEIDIASAARKAASVSAMHMERRRAREQEFGAAVQPIPGHFEGEPVSLSDDDATVGLAMRLTVEAIQGCGFGAGPDEEDEDPLATQLYDAVLLEVVGPLIASLRLLPGGLLVAAPPSPKTDKAPQPLSPAELARARWLAKELPRLAREHEVHGGVDAAGKVISRTAVSELMPAEATEALSLAAVVQAWPLVEAPEGARKVFDRMEELFALAQPGMAFWRGQRPDLAASADIIHARLDEHRAARAEIERFLAGELAAHELSDPVAVRDALQARETPLRGTVESLDAERAATAAALAPISDALARLAVSGALG